MNIWPQLNGTHLLAYNEQLAQSQRLLFPSPYRKRFMVARMHLYSAITKMQTTQKPEAQDTSNIFLYMCLFEWAGRIKGKPLHQHSAIQQGAAVAHFNPSRLIIAQQAKCCNDPPPTRGAKHHTARNPPDLQIWQVIWATIFAILHAYHNECLTEEAG